MYKAVLFDLDGTLLNTLEDLTDSTNFALKRNGLPIRSIDEIRRFVGNGIPTLIKRALPSGTEQAVYNIVYEDFCEHYKHNMENKTKPYDNVNVLLEKLYNKGIKLAIVTNKIDYAAQELCGKLFGDYVKTIIGSDGIRPNKPAPDGLLLALEKLGVSKEEAVFVGDSEVDIQTAKNAEMDSIGVLWGFRDESQLREIGVKKTAKDIDELCDMLLIR